MKQKTHNIIMMVQLAGPELLILWVSVADPMGSVVSNILSNIINWKYITARATSCSSASMALHKSVHSSSNQQRSFTSGSNISSGILFPAAKSRHQLWAYFWRELRHATKEHLCRARKERSGWCSVFAAVGPHDFDICTSWHTRPGHEDGMKRAIIPTKAHGILWVLSNFLAIRTPCGWVVI